MEEGLDIEEYAEIFSSVATLPKGEIKKKFGDVLFEVVRTAKQKEGYGYDEPSVLEGFRAGVPQKTCFDKIHEAYDEYTGHGWTHTIPNAMIMTAALLYGGGDYGRSICMAVETGFDTDCNGATVGSLVGMAQGIGAVPDYWKAPMNDTLCTTILGVGRVKISVRARQTLEHIENSEL